MPKMKLRSDPYELTLYCPFYGHQVVANDDEEGSVDPCEHVVCCGLDDPGESEIKESDVVFGCFAPAPASRNHVFAFREPKAQPIALSPPHCR